MQKTTMLSENWRFSKEGDLAELWMRSSQVVRASAYAKVATVLDSIAMSSDIVKSKGRQIKQC